jgi:hypothetical protein
MPFDEFHEIGEITEARRKAVAQSIRTISPEELKKLGDELFAFPDHPWREKFFQLIADSRATFIMPKQAKASFFFTIETRTSVCGVCPRVAWDHCQKQLVR